MTTISHKLFNSNFNRELSNINPIHTRYQTQILFSQGCS